MRAQAETEEKKLDRKLQLKTFYIKKVLLNRFYPPLTPHSKLQNDLVQHPKPLPNKLGSAQ